jgi:hypothetical protein
LELLVEATPSLVRLDQPSTLDGRALANICCRPASWLEAGNEIMREWEALEALNIIMIGSAVVPLTILGFVIRYFFRAARRNDEREAAEALAARKLRADDV